ncbi:MAG: YidC/Oxa1 family membrane protein insertase [Clostridiaceae bacterium]|nr:YidC/Oxa1 family membrane protein insertase [Clostridia bacterium]MDY3870492.1 YidC/Oxa1 family membrane protein insertase [Clostridiaceae bacterium]
MYEFLYKIISTPFGYVMRWIYMVVGNYALSLFLFALLVKVLMLPLTFKQKRSALEMQRINPMIQKIQKTYARDQRRMQEEMQNLYDREGVSPMSGCGTMLLIFPIMIGLYGVIIQPLTYFMQLTGDQIAQIAELLNYQIGGNYHYQIELATLIYENFDKVAHVAGNLMQVNFSLGPISMAAKPTFSQVSVLWLLPIVSGATSYLMSWLQQKMNPMQQSNPQMQGSNKMMMLMMPLMSIWFGFMLPVGLTWYWICNNVLAAIQEVLMSIWTKKQLEKSQNK